MSDPVQQEIKDLVTKNEVVLFMKGTRAQPRCGFSAAVTEILDEMLDEYEDVDVLARPEIREGVKAFSSWPTIPQLYVRGQFIGGADIVREMASKGELEKLLKVEVKPVEPPTMTVTPEAATALKEALADAGPGATLRFKVGKRYEYALSVDDATPNDVRVEVAGIRFILDRSSARRADKTTIDFKTRGGEGGFKITNPNEPAKVRAMDVTELKEKLGRKENMILVDVRTDEERQIARLEGALPMGDEAMKAVEGSDKANANLVFFCHHGRRSAAVAQSFVDRGWRNVWNVEGGIDAWSQRVDPAVPRY